MKKIWMTIMSMILIGVLAACGTTNDGNNDTANDDQNDSATEQEEVAPDDGENATESDDESSETADENAESGVDMAEQMKQIDFAEFELDVEYNDDKEYDVEIDKDSSGMYKAEVDDELNNKKLKGDEAFEYIYPLLKNISITPESTKDEVIKAVLQAFDLDTNYDEFDVEFIFHDGTKVEYEDEKK